MTKKLEFSDWAVPFTVPQGLSKEEVARYLSDHEMRRSRYYAQFNHTQERAQWCQWKALLNSPAATTKN